MEKSTTLPRQNAQEEYKIFLVGLSKDQGIKQLTSFFSRNYQSFLKVEMKKRNRRNGKISGYAFLSVTSKQEYDHIVRKKKFTLFGRGFFAKPYLKGDKLNSFKKNINERRIFMFGLPSPLSDTELEQRLQEVFGHLECAFVVENNQTRINGKGLGYGTFDSQQAAQYAIVQGEFEMKGRKVKVLPYNKNQKKRGGNKSFPGKTEEHQAPRYMRQGGMPFTRKESDSDQYGNWGTPSQFPSSPHQNNIGRREGDNARRVNLRYLGGDLGEMISEQLPRKTHPYEGDLKVQEAILKCQVGKKHRRGNLRMNGPKGAENWHLIRAKMGQHRFTLDLDGMNFEVREKAWKKRMRGFRRRR